MKKLLFLIIPFFGFCQNPVKVTTVIDHVTVYYSGAAVERVGKINLLKGKNQFVFTGISPQIDVESIQISSSQNLDFNSIQHQLNNQLAKDVQAEINQLNIQKKDIEDKLYAERQNLKVYQREEEMLLKNQVIGGTYAGLKANDLREAVDFHRSRLQENLKKQLEIKKFVENIELEERKINQKLTEATNENNNDSSEIIVEISSKEPLIATDIKIAYMVKDAGWAPSYNLKLQTIAEPLEVLFKGNIFQYSGEDWKNVKLSLSNSTLKKTGETPALLPWFWGNPNNYDDYFKNSQILKTGFTQVSGTVVDAMDKTPIPGAYVLIKGTLLGASTDANGFYKINIPPDKKNETLTLIFNSIGYKPTDIIVRNDKINVELEQDTKALEEVVVTGYGTQYKKSVTGASTVLSGNVAGVNVTNIKKLVVDEETPTSQNYDLIEKFTVLADGKEVSAELKAMKVPAIFEYFVVPKIDPDAFLTAKILDWNKYGFLPGDVSLFTEGTYVGKTKLNLDESDTLTIPLGRDKNILIKREKLRQYSKSKLIGNKKTDNIQYEITVRNLKKQTANFIIEDQFPLSNNKEVEVFDKSADGAEINNESGKVIWTLKLDAGKEQKLNLKYAVKYPKSGYVELER